MFFSLLAKPAMVSIGRRFISKPGLDGAEPCIGLITFQNSAPFLEATNPGVVTIIQQAFSRQSLSASDKNMSISYVA